MSKSSKLDEALLDPFGKVSPNGRQMSLSRDTLQILGHPDFVRWKRCGNTILLESTESNGKPSWRSSIYRVTRYKNRAGAMIQVPPNFRGVFIPRVRYRVSKGSGYKGGKGNGWIQFESLET